MKRLTLALLGLLVPALAPACYEVEEPEPITVVNKSAEEAAALTTDATCDYISRCGIIEVTCADCAAGSGEDCGGCTYEQIPVSQEECVEEVGPELAAGFSCQELTAEEAELVDECLAALADAECPSIETIEEDEGGPENELAACDVLSEIMERCYEQAEEPSDEPMPG